MVNIPSGIFEAYHTIADLLITDVNVSTITLYYKVDTFTSESDNSWNSRDDTPGFIGPFGGRTAIGDLPERDHQQSSGNYSQVQLNQSLACRAYFDSKDFDNTMRMLAVNQNKNIVKIITYTSETDFTNVTHADVTTGGITHPVRLIKPPVPYGLGPTKRYSESYWEVIE